MEDDSVSPTPGALGSEPKLFKSEFKGLLLASYYFPERNLETEQVEMPPKEPEAEILEKGLGGQGY